jgi:hypothetical protein
MNVLGYNQSNHINDQSRQGFSKKHFPKSFSRHGGNFNGLIDQTGHYHQGQQGYLKFD